MSKAKIKKIEKDIEKNLEAKAKAPSKQKLAFTKKLKKLREDLKTLKQQNTANNNTGLASLDGTGLNYSTKRKAEIRTDEQSGKGRTDRPKSLPEGKNVKVLNAKPLKKGMGGRATVSPNQKSRQLELPKDNNKNSVKKETSKKSSNSEKDSVGKEIARALLGPQKKSKIGKLTADSTDRGMSKFMGTDEEIAEQEMDEEMNFRKGGMPSKKTYGMRAGGFTKRGGMYKKGY